MENVEDVGAGAAANFDELRQQLSQRTQEVRAAVGSFVDERPLTAVGIAFGIGYLLSGALVSRLTARVIGVGGRIVLGNALRTLAPGLLLGALGLQQQQQEEAGGARAHARADKPSGSSNRSQH